MLIGVDGELSGTGTIVGSTPTVVGGVNNFAGSVMPGNSPGILTIEGNYTQGDRGTLVIEVGGPAPGEDYDQLAVSGEVVLGGKLELVFLDRFVPAGSETFEFIRGNSVDGFFDDIEVQGLPAGLAARLRFDGDSVDVEVGGTIDPKAVCDSARPELSVRDGLLFVIGTNRPDFIRVNENAEQVLVTVNGGLTSFDRRDVSQVVICGRGKPDNIALNANLTLPAVINGGNGPDRIVGGSQTDVILGGRGHDRIYGNGGNDSLLGAGDNDSIFGGPGDDFVHGGSGRDYLAGEAGSDTLFGSSGPDRLLGGGGGDLLDGGTGIDRLWGHTGRDLLVGGTGSDSLWGGADEDLLVGGRTTLRPNELALVFEEWTSERTFAARIGNILGVSDDATGVSDDVTRSNGTHYLKPASEQGTRTVFDDGVHEVHDYLKGQSASDWLFASVADTIRGLGKTDVWDVL